MSEELWRLDATAMAAGIRQGDFSSRDVVQACLDRLEAVNPQLNAVVETRPEQALVQADLADQATARGDATGSLHGVPVGIKTNQDVAGWATVNGCAAWQDRVATENSPCVQNWLDAGAIVIGRTNTPEFSVRWESTNDLYGATANPWDAARTPGGSSGGSAAAVAAGISPMASGTDLGGSLRQPAMACGVASIRPGRGRVPDHNATDPGEPGIGFQLMNVNGHLARSVRDLELGLKAMMKGSWRDPWWTPVPFDDSPVAPHRLALAVDPGNDGMTANVRAGVERAGQLLANADYEVSEALPPDMDAAVGVWETIVLGELALGLEPAVRGIAGPTMLKAFDLYRQLTPDNDAGSVLAALAERRRVLRNWLGFFQDYPLIVAPVGTEQANLRDDDISSLERCREVMASYRMTIVGNALGLSVATVPVGIADGLPQAVQIIGPPFAEERCLAAAAALEAAAGALTPIDPR